MLQAVPPSTRSMQSSSRHSSHNVGKVGGSGSSSSRRPPAPVAIPKPVNLPSIRQDQKKGEGVLSLQTAAGSSATSLGQSAPSSSVSATSSTVMESENVWKSRSKPSSASTQQPGRSTAVDQYMATRPTLSHSVSQPSTQSGLSSTETIDTAWALMDHEMDFSRVPDFEDVFTPEAVEFDDYRRARQPTETDQNSYLTGQYSRFDFRHSRPNNSERSPVDGKQRARSANRRPSQPRPHHDDSRRSHSRTTSRSRPREIPAWSTGSRQDRPNHDPLASSDKPEPKPPRQDFAPTKIMTRSAKPRTSLPVAAPLSLKEAIETITNPEIVFEAQKTIMMTSVERARARMEAEELEREERRLRAKKKAEKLAAQNKKTEECPAPANNDVGSRQILQRTEGTGKVIKEKKTAKMGKNEKELHKNEKEVHKNERDVYKNEKEVQVSCAKREVVQKEKPLADQELDSDDISAFEESIIVRHKDKTVDEIVDMIHRLTFSVIQRLNAVKETVLVESAAETEKSVHPAIENKREKSPENTKILRDSVTKKTDHEEGASREEPSLEKTLSPAPETESPSPKNQPERTRQNRRRRSNSKKKGPETKQEKEQSRDRRNPDGNKKTIPSQTPTNEDMLKTSWRRPVTPKDDRENRNNGHQRRPYRRNNPRRRSFSQRRAKPNQPDEPSTLKE